jgi:hypothetical protein
MRRRLALALSLVAAIAACTESTTTAPGSSGGGTSGTGNGSSSGSGGGSNAGGGSGQAAAGTVTGIVLDTQGRPIANAKVWLRPAVTTGLVETRTGSDGRYTARNLGWVPYYAQAWTEVTYNGKRYCLRMGMPNASDFDAFSPDEGAVRNFRWQLEGVIEDLRNYDGYFGGEIRLFSDGSATSADSVELRFAPNGPLVDGSTGRVVTRMASAFGGMVYDVPLGEYTVSAKLVRPGGARAALKVGRSSSALATSTSFGFEPSGGCSNGNGLNRGFLYWGEAS